MLPFLKLTHEIMMLSFDLIYAKDNEEGELSLWKGNIKFLESPKHIFAELGNNFKDNYTKYFY